MAIIVLESRMANLAWHMTLTVVLNWDMPAGLELCSADMPNLLFVFDGILGAAFQLAQTPCPRLGYADGE